MPEPSREPPNKTCSRYVGSGHQLRDTAGPCSTLTSRPHQVDRPREPDRSTSERLRDVFLARVTGLLVARDIAAERRRARSCR